ncbi:MAG: glycerophosphodiester phosphodiesterase family protein, partial [Chloroflexota bacterium]
RTDRLHSLRCTTLQLKTIPLNDAVDNAFIPSFVDVLDTFAGKTYLEIHLQSSTAQTVQAVCALIEQYPQLNDMYELTTFEPAIINLVHAQKPSYPCDLLFRVADWMTDEMAIRLQMEQARLANPRGVHLFPYQINVAVLSRFEALGLSVHCGVTNDVAEFERICALGVEQILTDDIHLYLTC